MKYHRIAWAAVTCLMLLVGPGCSQFDLRRRIPWLDEEKNEALPPEKVVAIWTDTVLYQPDQPAQRGFGGRLMFYKGGDSKSIKVEGTLIVYAYDEEGRDKQDFQSRSELRQSAPSTSRKKGAQLAAAPNSRPDRKFVITPEQFEKHYSKSNLGHSYSVWVPWDEAGGPQREISLIVRFIPTKGSAVIGEQTTQILPGALPAESAEQPARSGAVPGALPAAGLPGAAAAVLPAGAASAAALRRSWDPAVQQASHQEQLPAASVQTPSSADGKGLTRMQTSTIGVPLQSHLRTSAATAVTSRLEQARAASRRAVPEALPDSATAPAPSTPAGQAPSIRYAPLKYQAPSELTVRPKYDRVPWRPHPAEQQSSPESPPQAASGS